MGLNVSIGGQWSADESHVGLRPWYRRPWFLSLAAVAVTVWAVVRVGPRIPFPGAWYTGERWPYPSLDELQAYKRTSPVGYLLAEFVRLDESPLLVAFYFFAALGASVLLALWVWSELAGSAQRARGFRIAMLAPVTGVLFLTLGGYDPFTALGWVIALFAWKRHSQTLLILAGVYLGFQHFEQAALMAVSWGMVVYALRSSGPQSWQKRCNPIWMFPGVLAGKLLLTLVLFAQGIDPFAGRGFWVASSELLRFAIIGSANFAPILTYSLFAGVWAVVIVALLLTPSNRKRLLLVVAVAIPGIVAIVTLDHTRVFVMMTVPLVAIMIVYVLQAPQLRAFAPLPILLEVLAWVMVPVTLQGTSTVYIDSTNFLDMTIVFTRQLLGWAPVIPG